MGQLVLQLGGGNNVTYLCFEFGQPIAVELVTLLDHTRLRCFVEQLQRPALVSIESR